MTRWSLEDLPDQTGRRWLVTGATHGLGEATARAAASAGATLVVPARDVARAKALTNSWGGAHEVLPCDLSSLDSVRRAAASVDGSIDVLVNNAGTMTVRREETADGFERVLGVNLLGPFALTNLLLPRVRDRVVIVGSDAHRSGRLDLADPHFRVRRWGIAAAYAQSKLGDMLWGLALERRVRDKGVGVQLVHPGWVMSNMQSAVGHAGLARAITVATTPMAQSADRSALCSLFAATQDLPPCSYTGPDGPRALRGWPSLLGRSAAASDPRAAERLWSFAADETGTDAP